MSAPQGNHYRWEGVPRREVLPGISVRPVEGARLTFCQVLLAEGGVHERHSHEAEQICCVLEGRLRFWVGDGTPDPVDVVGGEVLHVPANVPHRSEAIETTLMIDVSSPARDDLMERYRAAA